jgi:hypothetical protein
MVWQLRFPGGGGHGYQILFWRLEKNPHTAAMREKLAGALRAHVRAHHPDLLLRLEEEKGLREYMEDSLDAVEILAGELLAGDRAPCLIEECCLDQLHAQLGPSKFELIRQLAEEQFPQQYRAFQRVGILVHELANLVEICQPLFEIIGLSPDGEDDGYLREALTAAMRGYFKQCEREIVKSWPIISINS